MLQNYQLSITCLSNTWIHLTPRWSDYIGFSDIETDYTNSMIFLNILDELNCSSRHKQELIDNSALYGTAGIDCAFYRIVAAGNPLPSVVHATLSREQIGSGRIIVIGDIHGCSLELQDLLDE